MQAVACDPGRMVIEVRDSSGAPLEVDISAQGHSAFRRASGLGVSPIGEYADWSRESKPRRDALDAVVACVNNDAKLGLGGSDPSPPQRRVPWLMLAAGVSLAATLIRGGLRISWRGRSIRDACVGRGAFGIVALAGIAVASFAARAWLVPMRFVHQNGQGPLWVEIALGSTDADTYGPGYPELFGWIARLGLPAPDTAVFWAMAACSAIVPVAGWWLARGSGASVATAWLIAVWLAAHPLLARLAHSESYFGAQVLLLFAAAAILSWGARHARRWLLDATFGLAVLTAGLLVSQVARIHPTSWLAAATVPLVVAVQPGRARRRLLQTIAAAAGIGVVVLLTSFDPMYDVMTGQLGKKWQPTRLIGIPELTAAWHIVVVLSAALVLVARRRMHALAASGALGLTLAVAASADLLAPTFGWIADAYRIQYLPAVLSASVALVHRASGRFRQHRWIEPACVLVIGVVLLGWRWEQHTTVPTDVLEQSWSMQWRDGLPPGSRVFYVGRAGDRVFILPLYEGMPARAIAVGSRRMGNRLQRGDYLYRSSLCSTGEGRKVCEELERGVELTVVMERTERATPSLPWLPLEGERVRLGLYRVATPLD